MRQRRIISVRIAVCGVLAAALLHAQDARKQTAAKPETPLFSTGATLVPVKVVVRDKKGNAVENLKKEDFILKDRGKVQTISAFSVGRSEISGTGIGASGPGSGGTLMSRSSEPQVVTPTRFIAYVFDDVNTDIGDLIQAREGAIKQLKETMDPETRVAVFTVSGQNRMDFTADAEAIIATMRSIRRYSADDSSNDCPALNYFWANKIINQGDEMAFNAAVAEYLSCSPITGPDAETIAKNMVRALAFSALSGGQRETALGLTAVADVTSRMRVLPGERMVVYVSGGYYLDQSMRVNEQQVLEAAIAAKVSVNTLDARGVYVVPISNGLARNMPPALLAYKDRMVSEFTFLRGNILAEFANGTGGMFISNTNGYEQGFHKLTAEHEPTYILSFAPNKIKYDGSYHALDVKLNARPGLDIKGLEIKARAGYYAPKAANSKDQSSADQIREAVFAREETIQIPLDLTMQFKRDPQSLEAQLNVTAKIGIETIPFRKSGDRNTTTLTLVTAAFDRNGIFVKGVQSVATIKLTDERREQFINEGGVSITTELLLPPGGYSLRVVVRDSEGKSMAARNSAVEIPF